MQFTLLELTHDRADLRLLATDQGFAGGGRNTASGQLGHRFAGVHGLFVLVHGSLDHCLVLRDVGLPALGILVLADLTPAHVRLDGGLTCGATKAEVFRMLKLLHVFAAHTILPY